MEGREEERTGEERRETEKMYSSIRKGKKLRLKKITYLINMRLPDQQSIRFIEYLNNVNIKYFKICNIHTFSQLCIDIAVIFLFTISKRKMKILKLMLFNQKTV